MNLNGKTKTQTKKKGSIAALLNNTIRLRILITVPLRYFSHDQGEVIKVKGTYVQRSELRSRDVPEVSSLLKKEYV